MNVTCACVDPRCHDHGVVPGGWHQVGIADVYHGPCDSCGKCSAHPDGTYGEPLQRECDLVDGWINEAFDLVCGECFTKIVSQGDTQRKKY